MEFIELEIDRKIELVGNLALTCRQYDITLQVCCNEYLFEKTMPANTEPAVCIDGNLIARTVGEPVSTKKDPSQRNTPEVQSKVI